MSTAESGPVRHTGWRAWLQLFTSFFSSAAGKRYRKVLVLLIVFAFAVAGVQVVMSYAARDFMTAIAERNTSGYWHHLWRYAGTFALAIPLGVFYRYTEERLGLSWRQWMTQHLIKRYFYNRAYYRLKNSGVDNPDQRIGADVENFTTRSLSFLLILLNSIVTLVAFLGVLWSISKVLVAVLFVYAIAGTLCSVLIGRRLIGLHNTQSALEADLRHGLIRVRDHAESIAFYRGEKREHRSLIWQVGSVVNNYLRIIGWNRNLAFFTTGYNYAALLVPVVVVAPLFLDGKVEFGVISQATGAFAQVLAALSLIITQFDGISRYAASANRLRGVWDAMDDFDLEEKREQDEAALTIDESRNRSLQLRDLTVQTPDRQRDLVLGLNVEVSGGKSLLLMGSSGTGKSSVLRTIAGIWPSGAGEISRPLLSRMFFLPQRPYMVTGSLREQLLYPAPDRELSEEEMRKALREVNLEDLPDRAGSSWDEVREWENVLSLGEQQRLSFARLFLHRPAIAFLDEATSALDEENERLLYTQLRESGITFISVGHRSTLREFHDQVLTLQPDGSFVVENGTVTGNVTG